MKKNKNDRTQKTTLDPLGKVKMPPEVRRVLDVEPKKKAGKK